MAGEDVPRCTTAVEGYVLASRRRGGRVGRIGADFPREYTTISFMFLVDYVHRVVFEKKRNNNKFVLKDKHI